MLLLLHDLLARAAGHAGGEDVVAQPAAEEVRAGRGGRAAAEINVAIDIVAAIEAEILVLQVAPPVIRCWPSTIRSLSWLRCLRHFSSPGVSGWNSRIWTPEQINGALQGPRHLVIRALAVDDQADHDAPPGGITQKREQHQRNVVVAHDVVGGVDFLAGLLDEIDAGLGGLAVVGAGCGPGRPWPRRSRRPGSRPRNRRPASGVQNVCAAMRREC